MEAIGVAIGGGFAYAAFELVKKAVYKREKNYIYKNIKKGLKEADFEKVAEFGHKLEIFDNKNKNFVTGKPKKKLLEKILRKDRQFKLDKVEELFNIPKEVLLDAKALKEKFEQEEKDENFLKKGQIMLASINNDEKRENEVLNKLKLELDKIKRRQIAQNNSIRKIIDDFNLTNKINQIHQEYENLFISTFENEHNSKVLIDRTMKKQILLNKLKAKQKQIDKNKYKNNKSC